MKFLSISFLSLAASFSAAQTIPIGVELNSSVDVRNVLWASRYDNANNGTVNGSQIVWGIGNYAAGPVQFQVDISVGELAPPYSVMANWGTEGVAIALDSAFAETVTSQGLTWEQALAGPSQAEISQALTEITVGNFNNASKLFAIFNQNRTKLPRFDADAVFYSFGTANRLGTVRAAPVPEPASLAAFGLGAAVLGWRRKRVRR